MAKIKRKKPKKVDVNAPDEFQETMARVAPFIERHGGKLITGFLVLLVVVAGIYLGAKWMKSRKEAKNAALQSTLNEVISKEEAGDKEGLKKVISNLEKRSVDTVAALLVEAAGYAGIEQWSKAAQTYKLVLTKLSPDDPMVPYVQQALMEALIKSNDFSAVAGVAKELQNSKTDLFKGIGEVYEGDVNNPSMFKKALSTKPDKAEALYVKALDLFHKNVRSAGDMAALMGNLTTLRLLTLGSDH